MLEINTKKCNGCSHLKEGPRCIEICPGDLFFLNENNKATLYDPSECWDCFACVKACPRLALSIYLPFQINESMTRLFGRVVKNETVWEVLSPEGNLIKRFKVQSSNKNFRK
jgi:adenylylsulfate reductase subunit B